jgi:hypothetical protein
MPRRLRCAPGNCPADSGGLAAVDPGPRHNTDGLRTASRDFYQIVEEQANDFELTHLIRPKVVGTRVEWHYGRLSLRFSDFSADPPHGPESCARRF